MAFHSSNETFFVSAPTSPSRSSSINSMYYYSAPASPSRGIGHASFDFDSEPISTPKSREDVSSNLNDDFEFETSRKFYFDDFEFEKSQNFEYSMNSRIFGYSGDQLDHQHQHQQQRHHGESLSSMAFADELFCNGRVAPLKLPPRLWADKDHTSGQYSSTASSPKSPSSMFRLSFSRRSLWNHDFDPFATALENIRDEKKGRRQENHHRRARSQSPLRTNLPMLSSESKNWKPDQKPTEPNGPVQHNGSAWGYPTWVPNQTEQKGSQNSPQKVGLSSYELAKPKGYGIAKKLRPLKVGHEKPMMKTGERVSQETKRQGIRGMFRSASMNKECSGHTPGKDQSSITVWKPQKMRSFSFRSVVGEAHSNGKKRVAGEMKSIIHYRPKLFLCMGFGFKAPRK